MWNKVVKKSMPKYMIPYIIIRFINEYNEVEKFCSTCPCRCESEVLAMFTIKRIKITTDKIKRETFSFLTRNAIQEILIEFIAISIMEIITNVVFMYLSSGYGFNTEANDATRKKIIIVLKYVDTFFFCFRKYNSLKVKKIYDTELIKRNP
jgi:hypothetical protein